MTFFRLSTTLLVLALSCASTFGDKPEAVSDEYVQFEIVYRLKQNPFRMLVEWRDQQAAVLFTTLKCTPYALWQQDAIYFVDVNSPGRVIELKGFGFEVAVDENWPNIPFRIRKTRAPVFRVKLALDSVVKKFASLSGVTKTSRRDCIEYTHPNKTMLTVYKASMPERIIGIVFTTPNGDVVTLTRMRASENPFRRIIVDPKTIRDTLGAKLNQATVTKDVAQQLISNLAPGVLDQDPELTETGNLFWNLVKTEAVKSKRWNRRQQLIKQAIQILQDGQWSPQSHTAFIELQEIIQRSVVDPASLQSIEEKRWIVRRDFDRQTSSQYLEALAGPKLTTAFYNAMIRLIGNTDVPVEAQFAVIDLLAEVGVPWKSPHHLKLERQYETASTDVKIALSSFALRNRINPFGKLPASTGTNSDSAQQLLVESRCIVGIADKAESQRFLDQINCQLPTQFAARFLRSVASTQSGQESLVDYAKNKLTDETTCADLKRTIVDVITERSATLSAQSLSDWAESLESIVFDSSSDEGLRISALKSRCFLGDAGSTVLRVFKQCAVEPGLSQEWMREVVFAAIKQDIDNEYLPPCLTLLKAEDSRIQTLSSYILFRVCSNAGFRLNEQMIQGLETLMKLPKANIRAFGCLRQMHEKKVKIGIRLMEALARSILELESSEDLADASQTMFIVTDGRFLANTKIEDLSVRKSRERERIEAWWAKYGNRAKEEARAMLESNQEK